MWFNYFQKNVIPNLFKDNVMSLKYCTVLSIFPLLLLTSCDSRVVSVNEYEHMRSVAESLQAENDSLRFELLCLQDYVECLEEDNADLVKDLNSIPLVEE